MEKPALFVLEAFHRLAPIEGQKEKYWEYEKMFSKRTVCMLFIAVLVISSTSFMKLPTVLAGTNSRIVLPWSTGWENGDWLGLSNIVDSQKDFSSAQLAPVDNTNPGFVGLPTNIFGYSFGSRELLATGTFGSSYSFCYFSLFDQSAGCDIGPPFKLKPRTYISVWYYHARLKDCMIDGLLYNQNTGASCTLRDFNYQGKYIVDQNNVRLHPACRSNDNANCWNFSCFDLSQIWNSDPGNWWVEKIWVAFDNGNDHIAGQAKTVFDTLTISYGVEGATTNLNFVGGNPDNGCYEAYTSGSVVPCGYYKLNGYYYLLAKLAVTGKRFYFKQQYAFGTYNVYVYPFKLSVSVGRSNTQIQNTPEPTGINITHPDPNNPAGRAAQFLRDVEMTVLSDALPFPGGVILDAMLLAQEAFGLLSSPGQQPTYTWPDAITYYDFWSDPHTTGVAFAQGEAYVCIPMLTPGVAYSIPITFNIGYYCEDGMGDWSNRNIGSVTVNLDWNSQPDPMPSSSTYVSSISSYGYIGTGRVLDPNNLVGSSNDGKYAQLYAGNPGDSAWAYANMNTAATGHVYVYGYSRPGYTSHLVTSVLNYSGTDWITISDQMLQPKSSPYSIDCGSITNYFTQIKFYADFHSGYSASINMDAVHVIGASENSVSSINSQGHSSGGAVNNPNYLIGYNDGVYTHLHASNSGDYAWIVGNMNTPATGHVYVYGYSSAGYTSHLVVSVSSNGYTWVNIADKMINPTSGPYYIDCGSTTSSFSYIKFYVDYHNGYSAGLNLDAVHVLS